MQTLFQTKKLDALYITKPENIQYHTGFKGSFAITIITPTKTILITDPRYQEQAKRICYKHIQIEIVTKSLTDLLANLMASQNTIGFEANHLSYNQTLKLRKTLKGKKLIPLSKELDQLRTIKTASELRIIKQAQKLNEKTLSSVIPHIKAGITEKELAWLIEKTAHELGATSLAFPSIVSFGKNTASPHHTPSNQKLKRGDMILIDMGVKFDDYCSDMTRTFFTNSPTPHQEEIYNLVLHAQENTITNIKPGLKGKAGDNYSRAVIERAGYGKYFTHANGHGLGLEIHESPSLSSKAKHSDRLMEIKSNMAITVEPGIYLPDKFGIRIEDIVITNNLGCENITSFPKNIGEMILTV